MMLNTSSMSEPLGEFMNRSLLCTRACYNVIWILGAIAALYVVGFFTWVDPFWLRNFSTDVYETFNLALKYYSLMPREFSTRSLHVHIAHWTKLRKKSFNTISACAMRISSIYMYTFGLSFLSNPGMIFFEILSKAWCNLSLMPQYISFS